ncbi:MAG: hypothetical protein KR126chlam3_01453, partial [Chlamydiae bacterium]|nr:hypothetical protein [Chlamydiota bacterium]
FKSIATDPQYDEDTKKCAAFLVSYLNEIGLEAMSWETSKQPVIFAKNTAAGKDCPTLLIYQHYDVQPVDPLDLWESDPFKPTIREGKVYARGAQDNKGQCFYTITALKALLEESKSLNFNLKLFIEGEEESGSTGTLEIIKQKKEELRSDYLLVVDCGIPGPDIPAITLGMRGILTMDLEVRTADSDMHSGSMGGVAYNPIRALSHALAKCWDENGKIAIPHFYDEVQDLSPEEKKAFDFIMDEKMVRKEFGLKALCPDPGYLIGESVSIRPTLEINGINGGYTGEGFKTVLPAVATAKISCRLVPDQDPEKVFANFKKHLENHLPEGAALTIVKEHGSSAFRCNVHSLIAKRAAKAYEEVMGKPCKSILGGGSIPIIGELAQASGADVVAMGYGLDSDHIHAPNEHFGLDRFEQGFLTIGNLLKQFHVG